MRERSFKMSASKIVIYARVSTEKQGEESLENQIERCRLAIRKNENISLLSNPDIIKDIGSGGNDNREGFERLLRMIENKEVDLIVTTELSRISRRMTTLVNFMDNVQKNDVRIIFVMNNIDTTTAMGKAMLVMSGIFAEFERENIKSRVKNTLDTKAQTGNHTGGVAPFGYDLINKKLIPNREKAEIVKKIFTSYIKGKNLTEISNEYKVKKTTVRRILTSKTYIGTKVYGTRKTNSSGKVVKAEKENIRYIPNAHETIIDENTFNLVQRKINKNVDEHYLKRKNQQKKFLLYGLLKCYNGHTMYGSETTSNYRFYSCSMHGRLKHFSKTPTCPKKNISADKIEEAVLNDILNFDFSKVDISKSINEKQKKISDLELNLNSEKEKHSNLTDLYLENELSKEEYLKRKHKIDKRIENITLELEGLKQELKENKDYKKSCKLLGKVIEKLRTEATFEKKQQYLHIIINKVQFINDFEYELFFNI